MRSVSHCGQTISLYTLHPTWCQRSYTNSTKREITSQRFILSPFCSSRIPSDEIPMERPEFNRVLRLILTSFSSASSTTETRQTPLLCLFLSTIPNLQLSQILYMGGTIIPGIAAWWEWRGRKRERLGSEGKERGREGEREGSVM